MPIDPVTGGLIVAGAGLAKDLFNIGAQGNLNKKTRRWNEKMAKQSRQWSLDDWNMQNAYNHPREQMARLREAELNPNLVYGNGADVTSGPVRSSDTPQWSPRASEASGQFVGDGIQMFQNAEMHRLMLDNLTAKNTNELLKTSVLAAQAEKLRTSSSKDKQAMSIAEELRETSLQAAMARTKKLSIEADNWQQKMSVDLQNSLEEQLNRNIAAAGKESRERALHPHKVALLVEQAITQRTNRQLTETQKDELMTKMRNLEKDGTLKDLEIELKKSNMTWSDPAVIRYFKKLMDEITNL